MTNKIEEWLSEFSSENTKETYRHRIQLFFTATGLTPEKLESMTTDEIKHAILTYRAEFLKTGKQNTVLSIINAVRSYCAQIGKVLKFRKGQLGTFEADTESHVFTNHDLNEMFEVGDTTEKAILATSVSLGWEISAFLELQEEKIRRILAHAKENDEKFVFFECTREKEHEPRLGILNPLCIEWLTKYLETKTPSTDGRLFEYTEEGVNRILRRLALASALKTTGEIRFHNIRKWLMSRLSRCGFNEFQIKYILGKAIGVSDRTYLQTLKGEIEEKYPRVFNEYLNISPKGLVVTDKDSKAIIDGLKTEIQGLRQQLQAYESKNAETQSKMLAKFEDYDRELLEVQDKLHIKPRKAVKGEPDFT
jgi:integrase